MNTATSSRSYVAFISYSHADEAVARWLHRALETYRVPQALVGAVADGKKIPARLFPVFRDREELASAETLGARIHAALAQSEALIVIASRSAARSRWVNEEIRQFKALGKSHRVFCVIADGEPYAAQTGTPEQESFPPALRFQVNAAGQLSEQPAEPIAADIRPGKDGRRDALLKLIAGMLGLGLDALKQRDVQRRQRRLTLIAIAAVLASLLTSSLALFALQARNEAQAQRAEAEQQRAQAESARQDAERRQLESAQVADFLVDLIAGANPYESEPDLRVRTLLDRGAAQIEAELAEQPLVLGRLQFAMGRAYWSLSQWEEGEARMRRGLALVQESGGSPTDIAELQALLGRQLIYRERYAEAEALLRASLASLRRAHSGSHGDIALTLIELEKLIGQRDRSTTPEQFAMLREAQQIMRDLGQTDRWVYALTIAQEANLHKLNYRWELGCPRLLEAISFGRGATDVPPMSFAYMVENYARCLYFMGDYLAARPQFDQALELISAQVGTAAMELDWSLCYLARIEREQGRRDQARAHLQAVVANETAHPQTPDQRYLARALCGLAILDVEDGALVSARAREQRCRALLDAARGQTRVQHNVVHEAATLMALASGDTEQAVHEARAHVAVLERGHDPSQTDLVLAHGLHGAALLAHGDYPAAQAAFTQAEHFARTHYPPQYVTLGRVYHAWSALHEALGEPALAAQARSDAQAILAAQQAVPQTPLWQIPRRAND